MEHKQVIEALNLLVQHYDMLTAEAEEQGHLWSMSHFNNYRETLASIREHQEECKAKGQYTAGLI